MNYKMPSKIKIYEALGTLADENRVEVIDENMIKVYSSSRNKFYNVYFDFETMKAYSNDNIAYYIKWISYPMMIFLFLKGYLEYKQEFAEEVKGIHWKDLHMNYNIAPRGEIPEYDYKAIYEEVEKNLTLECKSYVSNIYEKLKKIKIGMFSKHELDILIKEKGLILEPSKAY